MHEEELKELGLTDNEVRIYLLLLQEGMLGPSDIAAKLGIHRPYTYDALERMKEKGFVSATRKDSKLQYQATRPKTLLEKYSLQLEKLRRVLPDLEKISPKKKEETRVEVYTGKYVYRTLLKDIIASLENKTELLLIGINEDQLLTEVEPIYLKQYLNIIQKRRIQEKIIIESGSRRIRRANLSYKKLTNLGKTGQIIYGNKVALFTSGTPHVLTIIESKDTADTLRRQFDLLWDMAK